MIDKIKCPKCHWIPNQETKWLCSCGYAWNTFNTNGICPNCSINWNITACLSCGTYSAHSEWYQTSNSILNYLLKNHFYELLLNLELDANILLDKLNFFTEEQLRETLLFLEEKGLIKLNNTNRNIHSWAFTYIGNINPPLNQIYYLNQLAHQRHVNTNTSAFLQMGEMGLLDIICQKIMIQGKKYVIKASIKKFTEIINSQESIKIQIKPVMSIKIMGEDFIISELNSTEQIIDLNIPNPTVWNWRIQPLKYGNKIIELIVSIKINLDEYGVRTKDLPIYKRKINVKVNTIYNLTTFLKKNWQWIIGTIIGSGVVWKILEALKII